MPSPETVRIILTDTAGLRLAAGADAAEQTLTEMQWERSYDGGATWRVIESSDGVLDPGNIIGRPLLRGSGTLVAEDGTTSAGQSVSCRFYETVEASGQIRRDTFDAGGSAARAP